jgi:cysteine-rich repeat protein
VLSNGTCVPAVCGNAVLESGEQCDDGDTAAADGCDGNCMIEPGNYCFGEGLSICRAGGCVLEPATAALGPDFSLDGAGTPSAAGTLLTQRSMIRTTAPVSYPVLVEATVVYSGFDVTYVGTRGDGLRDPTAADEPTDTLRARLSVVDVQLATGPGTTVIANTTPPFSPTPGVPYRVRFVDDGLMASVEWFNLTNLSEGVALQQVTSYHGTDDRAFVGGGDQGAVTVSDIRVCSAPSLPVTLGLVGHYSAIPSWTVARDMADVVSSWQDQSGNAQTLGAGATSPMFSLGLIGGQKAGIDFDGGASLVTTPFALTTDVSVFAVIHHRTPDPSGAIAHHGDRNSDWSMEQDGSGDPNVLHWQTNSDNANMKLTLTADTSYVMTGIFDGNARYFEASTFDGSTIAPVSIVDGSHTITTGDKTMFVGTSGADEASNAAIGELVYFNRALSDVERDAVIAYLQALWRPQ